MIRASAHITLVEVSDGLGIIKSEVQYYLSTSSTSQTGGKWGTTPPAWEDGKYYWQKIVTTYSDTSTSESTPVCITGGKGFNGKGVASITTEFYLSNSKTSQTGGSWQTKMPTWSKGKYLWTRSVITYQDPASTVRTTPICDSSWEAINSLEAGGRNLILRSQKMNEGFNSEGTLQENAYLDFNSYLLNKTNTGTSSVYYNTVEYPIDTLEPNTEYVLSFWCKASTARNIYVKLDTNGLARAKMDTSTSTITSSATTGGTCQTYTSATPSWERHSVQWLTAPTVSGTKTIVVGRVYCSASSTVDCEICGLKLEKGNILTDWTPAPEDVIDEINKSHEGVMDEIATLRSEVNTEFEVRENQILSTVAKSYILQDEFDTKFAEISTRFEQNSDYFEMQFSQLSEDIINNTISVDQKFEVINSYIRFEGGTIHLGQVGNQFEQVITNEKSSFLQGGKEIAYFANSKMYVADGEFGNSLTIGNFAFVPRANGSLDFKKVK